MKKPKTGIISAVANVFACPAVSKAFFVVLKIICLILKLAKRIGRSPAKRDLPTAFHETHMQPLIEMAEKGLIPDALIRLGIRSMLRQRLREESRPDPESQSEAFADFVQAVRQSPIAIATDAANEQHYEVPAALFELMLGPRLKYSCCYWSQPTTDLAAAEDAMLALSCERALLEDGAEILELGCGWGSLTLWMAEHYPAARITAVSNSHGQRHHIEAQCSARGLSNVRVLTADMRDFETSDRFDRVVSIEMFEHMRNYPLLMRRISDWLHSDGYLFVHLFCHRTLAYFYEPTGPGDWMAREFFTGGTMPSADLLLRFQDHLRIDGQWSVSGAQYARTLETWLERLDGQREAAIAVLRAGEGHIPAEHHLQRWRLFLLACAELFSYRGGSEWYVSHYRFRKQEADFR